MDAIFLLLCLLLNSSCRLICGIERLPSNEASVKSTHVTSTINCGPPKPFQNNTELKWRPGARNQSVFLPGEKAVFVCKKGFRQIGWLQTLTCQTNGSEKGSISLFLGKADIILFFFSLQNMFNWKMISFINPYCVPQLTDEFSPSQWKE